MNRTSTENSRPNGSSSFRSSIALTFKSALIKALVLSVLAYPFVVAVISMCRLSQNQSFSFAGFELSVVLAEHSGSATLAIGPEFFISVVALLAASTLVIWSIEWLLATRKR